MIDSRNRARLPTRQHAIAGIAAALSALAAHGDAVAQTVMKEMPTAAADQKRTSLHQEIALAASPQRIYQLLLDSKLFTTVSGFPAKIDPHVGGAFSMFGGLIVGRNVELLPGRRIVQAWRPTSWDPGVYSMVKFELRPRGSDTLLVLDHTGFPEGDYGHLYPGWGLRYWSPLKAYLAKNG